MGKVNSVPDEQRSCRRDFLLVPGVVLPTLAAPMPSPLSEAFQFIRSNDLKTIIARFNARDAHPVIQFFKYGLCGGAATVVHQLVVTALSLTYFPAGKNMIVNGQLLDEVVRNHNLLIANTLAFPFGLMTAYVTNKLWVFTPGRHSAMTEFMLFAGVGALGFFPGLVAVNWLAGTLHLPSVVAQLGFVFTSFLVNFICRKFVIFKG